MERMRGAGGPLLCIGDLLCDVADDDGADGTHQGSSAPPVSWPTVASGDPLSPSLLHHLFEENYKQLIESLSGNDHSWTALTLKLCAALRAADKLVDCADSNIELLLEKVGLLESILKRGDSAIAMTKALHSMQTNKEHALTDGLDDK